MPAAKGPPGQRPLVEFLTLANHAECHNGLLYLQGAGFDQLYRPPSPTDGQPAVVHFAIAIAVLVPWTATNRKHQLNLNIEDQDGKQMLKAESFVEVGRPVGALEGTEMRAPAVVDLTIPCPPLGVYTVTADIGGRLKRVRFRVLERPGLRRVS